MKKIIAFALALLMIFALAACGNESADKTAENGKNKDALRYSIREPNPDAENGCFL